ncbi:MAG: hypothetical protein FKY71_04835 [Spiribacter salinus]|uniref:DUF5615 domain-containing protein n=1 Tax=Spiribacter salinus TaxID=1335746 RepID=A0A540VTV3_9GAMM|nr:MAG: hypothetical protein FKY71_04835 [Spiribacter salinus]
MKFLVDAQLPRRLSEWFRSQGFDSVHTLDLPDGNRTSDSEITRRATDEGRTVVTKDDDFVYSFLLYQRPPRLLLISTGNISNQDLIQVFSARRVELENAFTTSSFVELRKDGILAHE